MTKRDIASATEVGDKNENKDKVTTVPYSKDSKYPLFHDPPKTGNNISDSDDEDEINSDETEYSDISISSNTASRPLAETATLMLTSSKERTAREGLRDSLRYMQKCLLYLAGITFLFILTYSAYYIHILRMVYGKERVAE